MIRWNPSYLWPPERGSRERMTCFKQKGEVRLRETKRRSSDGGGGRNMWSSESLCEVGGG